MQRFMNWREANIARDAELIRIAVSPQNEQAIAEAQFKILRSIVTDVNNAPAPL